MSATPAQIQWFRSPLILPEAQSLLALVDPPDTPVEFPAFLSGARDALNALSAEEVRLGGKPISALLDHLAKTIGSDAKGTRTQWDQDPMRGHGATAYRALAQPSTPGCEGGYACLKAVLLGLLLVRSRGSKKVSQKEIDQVIRFVRLGSAEVHGAHDLTRARVIASLPSTFIPSRLQAALAQRAGVPEALHPRLNEVARAAKKLFQSFWLLDRGGPYTSPGAEPKDVDAPKAPSPDVRPDRPRPPSPPPHPLSITSAGIEEPDAAYIFGPAHKPSAETAKAIADAAEAIDDRSSMSEGLMLETSLSTSVVERRTTALRLMSDVRQGFWARYQWDALSPGEMRHAVERLLDELKKLEGAPDTTRHEALTLGLLSASTGLPRARCHSIRTRPAEDEANPSDLLELDLGKLSLPLVGREDRYAPTPEQMPFLRVVEDSLPIYLPNEVTAELARLIPSEDGFVFVSNLAVLEEILDSLFKVEREHEPRITTARLFRGHQLEVLTQCGHPPSAQMVTGQTLGTPPVGLSYYTAQSKTLQDVYDRAVAHHGLTPSGRAEGPTHLVGSKLALTDQAWKSAVQSTSLGLINRPRDKRTTGRELLYLQDELVRATATIWMAGTSFRPTFRLGEVRASHVNWISGIAVIADKLTDSAHEGRLVPLAPTLIQSLGTYGTILDLMTKARDLKAAVRTAARQALTGEGPLFFFLDKHGKAQPIDAEIVLSRLPAGWNMPANFLRHRLATRLCEVECPGLYIQALMGHIEQGTQPFGTNSFMVPSEYLAATRNSIERVLQEDGWRPLLGGMGDTRIFLENAAPAGEELLRVESAYEEAVDLAFKRQRQDVDNLRTSMGEQNKAEVLELIGQVRPSLITNPELSHELDSSAITALRLAVTQDIGSAALAELRVGALREVLLQGRKAHQWKFKRLPYFFVARPSPSVHHPTFVPAHQALEQLRAHFVSQLNVDPGKDAPTATSAKLNVVLALILWQGVATWNRMASILEGLAEAEPISSDGEGIAIPFRISRFDGDPNPEASSEELTGAVALAAVTAKAHMTTVDRKEIEDLVAAWVPPEYLKSPKGRMLDVLFAMARIGHRFETPPPLRLAWSEEIRSVNMPLDRLRALFGQPATRTTDSDLESEKHETESDQRNDAVTSGSADDYKWLTAVLGAAKDGTKPFPDEKIEAPSTESNETKRGRTTRAPPSRDRRRRDACIRLRGRLKKWPYDGSLIRALTAYALDRLENGTPWSREVVPDTVYTYVVGAGGALRAYDPDMYLVDYEEEDFAEIYTSCIKRAPVKYKEKLTGYLAYFHGFLVEQHWAPPVSIGHPGNAVTSLPEVGYVAPNEMAACIAQLESERMSAEQLENPLTGIRATLAAISLGFAAGTRKKETLLRENRELVTDAGRRALLVRKNRWVSTKTHRSTRLVDLEPTMPRLGWTALRTWQEKSACLQTDSEAQRSLLFSDSVDGRQPLCTKRLARHIVATLRQSTRRRDAQVNWWRHTAVSNDILALFATTEMLDAIRRGTNAEGAHWLPDPSLIRQSLGGELPLGQPHAAGFRARRGHAQMDTPISTYTHTAGLIEPWACRRVSNELSSNALAAIAGLRPAALRQRLSRANLSASPSRPAVRFLVKHLAPKWPGTSTEEMNGPSLPATMSSDRIDSVQYCEALLRSLRKGDFQPLVDSRHLPPGAAQRLFRRLDDALRANPFGLNLGIDLPIDAATQSGIPRASAKASAPLSFARVDQDWVRQCVQHRIENPTLAGLWSIVLRGLNPRSGEIAVRSDQEFIAVLNNLPGATGQKRGSPYRVNVITNGSMRRSDREAIREIVDGTEARGCQIHQSRGHPPKGWMLAGVAVETITTGRRQIAALAFLAIASELLSP